MKSLNYFILLITVALFAACGGSGKDDKKIQTKNVDSNARVLTSDVYYKCWFNEQTLQKEVYHSKPLASKLDSIWTDSYGFQGYIRDLGEGIPYGVKFSFWTLCRETGHTTKVVFGIDSAGAAKFWAGVDLKDSIKTPNQWQQIHTFITFPKKIRPDDRITIYVWDIDKKEMYVDDLDLKFLY